MEEHAALSAQLEARLATIEGNETAAKNARDDAEAFAERAAADRRQAAAMLADAQRVAQAEEDAKAKAISLKEATARFEAEGAKLATERTRVLARERNSTEKLAEATADRRFAEAELRAATEEAGVARARGAHPRRTRARRSPSWSAGVSGTWQRRRLFERKRRSVEERWRAVEEREAPSRREPARVRRRPRGAPRVARVHLRRLRVRGEAQGGGSRAAASAAQRRPRRGESRE